MGKALIIAEKPSVASDIAKALRGFTKTADYYESDQYVLSSAIGHLLELTVPAGIEVKRGKWSFAHLPVIPPRFDLKPIERTESRLKLLARLIKRKDVDTLINACDAGREGELIFRYIVRHVGAKKPIRRLWLQSMTPPAIREGFANLRDDASMRPLADAAVCRSESDWLVGINGTRAMTAFNSKMGGFQLTTVGRVQTPTLAILVDREEKIKKFVPRNYWELQAAFIARSGTYPGRWFDENFSKEMKETDPDLKPERIWELQRAEALRNKCLGQPGRVSEENKPTTQLSPLLYDLTSLQREANARFAFSARRTLQIAQALYEKQKVITYPRTDSRALPEDYLRTVTQTISALSPISYGPFARQILEQNWIKPNKRVFNNAKVSDHFAIIPTLVPPKHLHEEETKLYDLITRRFLAIFYPAAEFLVTTRITRVANEPFKSEGKILVSPGWLAVYGKESQLDDDSPRLVPIEPNETVKTNQIEVVANQTRPPARFTEATLLSAMEGAGKLVEDEELREAMSAKGLGTPATRAAIIEGLIQEKYVHRTGRELQPTPKAFSIITLLRGLGIPELISPDMTGDWEFKLRQMEHGQLKRDQFMLEIAEMTRNIVQKAKQYESDTVPGDFETLNVPCPKCGAQIRETYRELKCQNCEFALRKVMGGRQLEISEAQELISKRSIGPLQGFRSKAGKSFAAVLKLTPDLKVEFDFGQAPGAGGDEQNPPDFSGKDPLGKCPKCASHVFEDSMSYVCEKAVGAERSCDFRTGKIILQRPIELAQVKMLLDIGKTDLLHKFISRKGRPFSAFLVVGEGGKVGFEFAPREKRSAPKKQKNKRPSEPE